MTVILRTPKEKLLVTMADMKDGQIAVITENNEYRGDVIQYFHNSFSNHKRIWITIGSGKNHTVDRGLKLNEIVMNYTVRILEEGEILIVEDNSGEV